MHARPQTAGIGTFLAIIYALMIAGCGSSEPSRFYMLKAVGWENQTAAATDTLRIGLHAFVFPEYLLRPNIVTLKGGNRVDLAEYDRWAEELDQNVMRVLSVNLTHLVPAGVVLRYPWRREPGVNIEIDGEVLRFGREEDGQVHLVVEWTLRREGSPPDDRHRFVFAQRPVAEGVEGTVEAMNDGVTALSQEIAEEIVALHAAE